MQAGNHVTDAILADFIRLISSTPELHGYAVLKLYASLREDTSQEALVLAGVWAIGEFGDVLLRNEVDAEAPEEQIRVTEKEVIDLLESLLLSHTSSVVAREYVLNALLKLSTRLPQNIEYAFFSSPCSLCFPPFSLLHSFAFIVVWATMCGKAALLALSALQAPMIAHSLSLCAFFIVAFARLWGSAVRAL